MDETNPIFFSNADAEHGPTFVKASGYYVMHPLLFMHAWNRSSSMGEVVAFVRKHWNQYAGENVLLPDKNGAVKEPKIDSNSLLNRVKTFRKNGAYMKNLPKTNVSRYNWSEIISQSKQYSESVDSPRESRSKGFFSR